MSLVSQWLGDTSDDENDGEIEEPEVLLGPVPAVAPEIEEIVDAGTEYTPLPATAQRGWGWDEEEGEEVVASTTTVAQSRKTKWVDLVCDAVSEVSEFADDFNPDGTKCMLLCDRLGCKRVRCSSHVPHLLCFECFIKHVMHNGENCPFCRGQLSKKMRV